MLKKCSKKSALKEKPVGKALVLGSSARGVEAKEAESEKKPVECFLCHGPHRLRKCPRKSVIQGNDEADKEPKNLGSSKGKAEAKREKRGKKKRVNCFLLVRMSCGTVQSKPESKERQRLSLMSHQRGFHPKKR
ncbi:hypothetical protein Gotur_012793 [Gossypium turneri]